MPIHWIVIYPVDNASFCFQLANSLSYILFPVDVVILFFPSNFRSVTFSSVHTLGVSSAGVIPAFVPPPVPKTCMVPLDPASSVSDAKKTHFGLFESKGESYVGFNLYGNKSEIFSSK